MTRALVPRLNLDDLPIPDDAQPCSYWTESMLEMAAHIGVHATLLMVDQFGGTDPYVPMDWTRSSFTELIGETAAREMSRVYGRENLQVPVGTNALRRARRAGILAAVRSGQMTLTQAATIRGMGSRSYISYLVNHSDDGADAVPMIPAKKQDFDPRQLVMFGDAQDQDQQQDQQQEQAA